MFLLAALTVCLAACDSEKEDPIMHPEDFFSVSPIALNVPNTGGEVELNVYGRKAWTLDVTETNSASQGWYSIDKTSGSGADVVRINITPSSSLTKHRRLVVTLTGEDGEKLNAVVLQDTQSLGPNEVLVSNPKRGVTLIWSTVNVDAPGTFCSSPDDLGKWYRFNSRTPWNPDNSNVDYPSTYVNDPSIDSDAFILHGWAEENDPCPEGYRIPTAYEAEYLYEMGITWVSADQTGYARDGVILGVDPKVASTATKETIQSLGGLFFPKSGWINEFGKLDRDWLVAFRTASSLNKTNGGMFLRDSGGYLDGYGWGDGPKVRAAMVRCVKKIQMED